jgi:hypothetical protein
MPLEHPPKEHPPLLPSGVQVGNWRVVAWQSQGGYHEGRAQAQATA